MRRLPKFAREIEQRLDHRALRALWMNLLGSNVRSQDLASAEELLDLVNVDDDLMASSVIRDRLYARSQWLSEGARAFVVDRALFEELGQSDPAPLPLQLPFPSFVLYVKAAFPMQVVVQDRSVLLHALYDLARREADRAQAFAKALGAASVMFAVASYKGSGPPTVARWRFDAEAPFSLRWDKEDAEQDYYHRAAIATWNLIALLNDRDALVQRPIAGGVERPLPASPRRRDFRQDRPFTHISLAPSVREFHRPGEGS